MSRRKKIYEGKAKILYEGPEPGTIVQYFKDDATAFNAEKKDVFDGKGVLNNRLSEFFMTGLNNIGVPTNKRVRQMNNLQETHRDLGLLENPTVDDPSQAGKFRVPSLRNVAVTGPYMHNGVFQELNTAIFFYGKFMLSKAYGNSIA